jgi:hypothetical protein
VPERKGNFIYKEHLYKASNFRDETVEVKNAAEVDLAKNRIELIQVSEHVHIMGVLASCPPSIFFRAYMSAKSPSNNSLRCQKWSPNIVAT